MNDYKIKKSKIFGGIFFLLLVVLTAWFTIAVFGAYTPFAYSDDYIVGTVRELLRVPDDETGEVCYVDAGYRIGLSEFNGWYPGYIFYYEGLEPGDEIVLPYYQSGYDDLSRDQRIFLFVLIALTVSFLTAAACLCGSEFYAARYFRKLILDKKYVYAEFSRSYTFLGKIRAVCTYENHIFESRYYSKDEYPFERGGRIKVYVDLDKDPEKYLVSEY